MFGKWCEENTKLCYALIIILVLVLLWYVGVLTVSVSAGTPVETVIAHRDFESALTSKYAGVTRDSGGMTADDIALEQAFMSGQTT